MQWFLVMLSAVEFFGERMSSAVKYAIKNPGAFIA
jgi:hypothetical protein